MVSSCSRRAVAAATRSTIGARRVLVSMGVHTATGRTRSSRSREVLFVSIHQFPFWPGTGALDDVGEGEGEGYSINLPVPDGTGEAAFLSLIEHIVMPVGRHYRPDLILISAGYDAHRDDPLGGLMLETSSFASMSNRMRALGEELGRRGLRARGGYDLSRADSVGDDAARPWDRASPGRAPPTGG